MALFKNTKIFIDLDTMMVSTDAIVASRLDDYFNTHEGSKFFFTEDIDKYKDQDIRALSQNILAEKANYNFLLDHFSWKVLSDEKFSDVNPAKMCHKIYTEIIQQPDKDNKVFAQIGSGLLMTSIAQSFKNLILDEKLITIYIYIEDWIPEYIMNGLGFFYGNLAKIRYVKGNKKDFIKENPCTTYFLHESVLLDECFRVPHTGLIEVFIPGNKFNTNVREVVEGVELRDILTNSPSVEYKEYNTKVYTLFLPI